GLAKSDAAKPGDGARKRVGIAGERDLTYGAEHAHAEAAASSDAELDLVEQPETHLGVGKDHLHVAARHVLKQLDVDVVAGHRGRQQAAQLPHDALRLLLLDLPVAHDLANTHVEW